MQSQLAAAPGTNRLGRTPPTSAEDDSERHAISFLRGRAAQQVLPERQRGEVNSGGGAPVPSPPATKSVLALQQVALRQRVEQAERGQDEDGGYGEDDEDGRHRRVGGGGLVDAEAGRQQVGELGDAPAPDHRGDGTGGERAQGPSAAAPEDGKQGGAAEEREHHQRQALAGEAVEDVASFVVEGNEAGDGEGAGDHGGGEGATLEVALHLLVAGAPGVAHEEDGGEVGAAGDEHRPDQQRQRLDPAGEGVAVACGGGGGGGARPAHRAHEERGDQRGDREGRPHRPPLPQADQRLAEGEAGTAQDDPQRRQRDRHVQGGEDRAEGRGEGGPEDDEDEDQPDVVRLPDGGERALDRVPRPLAALGSPRDEVPEAAAEVGAAEERVEGRPYPEDRRRRVGLAHAGVSSCWGA